MPSLMPPHVARFDRTSPTVAVVLAGGQARRMGGGDKALLLLAGRTLLDHVLARLGPQVDAVVLNANGDPARFAAWGLPVVADGIGAGPLAGVLAGLRWVRRHRPGADVLVVPTDTPFLPDDLVVRLRAGRKTAALACASSGGRLHPVVGLWRLTLADALAASLHGGERRVEAWMQGQGLAEVAFAVEGGDPFANLNTKEDLAVAEQRLRGTPRGRR